MGFPACGMSTEPLESHLRHEAGVAHDGDAGVDDCVHALDASWTAACSRTQEVTA